MMHVEWRLAALQYGLVGLMFNHCRSNPLYMNKFFVTVWDAMGKKYTKNRLKKLRNYKEMKKAMIELEKSNKNSDPDTLPVRFTMSDVPNVGGRVRCSTCGKESE